MTAHIAIDQWQEGNEFIVGCYCGNDSYASTPLEALRAFVEHADEQRSNDAITGRP